MLLRVLLIKSNANDLHVIIANDRCESVGVCVIYVVKF